MINGNYLIPGTQQIYLTLLNYLAYTFQFKLTDNIFGKTLQIYCM